MQAETTNCHLVKFIIAAVLLLHDAAFRGYSKISAVSPLQSALGKTT